MLLIVGSKYFECLNCRKRDLLRAVKEKKYIACIDKLDSNSTP